MSHLFRIGDPAFASRLAIPWAGYTVAWASSGTQPAIGNGTLGGSWSRVGDIFFYSITLIFGTTTTSGTGAWTFSLPLAVFNPFGMSSNGAGQAVGYHIGVSQIRARVTLNGAAISMYGNGQTVAWDATHPFTWANTDIARIGGWFPVAP